MPNGGSHPYRVGARSPSPAHTSDSEYTECHKRRYFYLGAWVALQWLGCVRRTLQARAGLQRKLAGLVSLRLLGGRSDLSVMVMRFLPEATAVMFRSRTHLQRVYWQAALAAVSVYTPTHTEVSSEGGLSTASGSGEHDRVGRPGALVPYRESMVGWLGTPTVGGDSPQSTGSGVRGLAATGDGLGDPTTGAQFLGRGVGELSGDEGDDGSIDGGGAAGSEGSVPVWPYCPSYRVGPDSPDSRSDGDSCETSDHKELYWWIAAWVATRWFRLVRTRRAACARRWRRAVFAILWGRVQDRTGSTARALQHVLAYTVDLEWVSFRSSERLEWMISTPPRGEQGGRVCPFLLRGGPPPYFILG